MRKESLESVLEAARKLPIDEQLRLTEQLAKEFSNNSVQRRLVEQYMSAFSDAQRLIVEQAVGQIIGLAVKQLAQVISDNFRHLNQLAEEVSKANVVSNQTQRALEAVEKTRGSMKGLDRDTIIWLAEDEELSGY